MNFERMWEQLKQWIEDSKSFGEEPSLEDVETAMGHITDDALEAYYGGDAE